MRLRFWLLGMDLFNALPWAWAERPWWFCMLRAADLTYGPDAPTDEDLRQAPPPF